MACEECVPGHFCVEGATTPMPCTAGTYANTTGAASEADCKDVTAGYYSPAGSVLPVECPGWGFCPGRAHDTENGDRPGSIPTVIAQGKKASVTMVNEVVTTNVTTLDLPIELEMNDEAALNETAVRLQVALLLDLPLEAVSLSRSQDVRRRLDMRVVFAVSIDPTLVSSAELAALEELWSSGEADGGSEDNAYQPLAARLSEALGAQVNVSKAIPAPVTSNRIVIRNQTIERLVLTDCGPGYWGANGKCIACSKGTYKPDGSVSECLSCPPGSYQNATGAIACLQCEPGHYCAEGAVLSLPCPGGMRMNKSLPVMSREEDCIVCPIGTSCPVGSEEAVPCGAGTYSDVERQASCTSCAPGTYTDAEGATACKQCEAGGYCPRGAAIPLPCKPGSFSSRKDLSLASECEPCPVGHACTSGATEPAPCSPGSIAPAVGLGSCEPCQPGTFQPDLGGVSCLGCGAGNYSANILSCEPCQVGECNPIHSASLVAAPLRVKGYNPMYLAVTLRTAPRQVGEFCVAGVSVGVRCPLMHSTTKGRGAASEDDCVCRAGYFKGGGSCEPCKAAGTNCTEEGVAIATLPLLPDWWRLPNSTQLQRCFPISNCTGGTDASALCGEGCEGDLFYPSCNPRCPPATLSIQPIALCT